MLRMAYGKKPTEVQLEKLIDHVVQQCLLAGVVVATVVADGEHRLIRRDGFGAAAKKFIDAIMASDSSGVQGQTNEAKATRIAALCSTIITYTQPTASLNLAGAFVPPMIAQPEPAAATTGGGAAAAAAAGVAQHGDIGIKKFDGTPYAFEVCGHKPPYFTVKYEDGDQEQMTNEEIAPLLVKGRSSEQWVRAMPMLILVLARRRHAPTSPTFRSWHATRSRLLKILLVLCVSPTR